VPPTFDAGGVMVTAAHFPRRATCPRRVDGGGGATTDWCLPPRGERVGADTVTKVTSRELHAAVRAYAAQRVGASAWAVRSVVYTDRARGTVHYGWEVHSRHVPARYARAFHCPLRGAPHASQGVWWTAIVWGRAVRARINCMDGECKALRRRTPLWARDPFPPVDADVTAAVMDHVRASRASA